jgi:hypothetical protein
MKTDFIGRIINASLIIGLASLGTLSFITPFNFALGVFVGMLWGTGNLFFTKEVLKLCLGKSKNSSLRLLMLILIKFPLLYFIGFQLLKCDYWPLTSLLIGLTLSFGVIISAGLFKVFREESLQ